jgi:hypothetical protein
MNPSKTIITVASWEERFILGIERSISKYRPSQILMFFADKYAEWTASNREKTVHLAKTSGINIVPCELPVDDARKNWEIIREKVLDSDCAGEHVVLDLTTMPREIIWELLWFLDLRGSKSQYVYYRPASYHDEWLTRDPQKPRLVFKLSGESKLGVKTALVVLAGYDSERISHLKNYFEPSAMLLGLQAGSSDAKNDERMREHLKRFGDDVGTHLFDLNAFSLDHGQSAIESELQQLAQDYNIIMSSLGPKTTAIALYRIHRKNRKIGLAYAPSREFNREYSLGIGSALEGAL